VPSPQYVIRITSYGLDEYNYLKAAWEVSNRLFRELGIDVLVEYENAALTDHLIGVGFYSSPVIVIEAGGIKKEIVDPDVTDLKRAMEEILLKSVVGEGEVRVIDNNRYDQGGRDPISFTAAA